MKKQTLKVFLVTGSLLMGMNTAWGINTEAEGYKLLKDSNVNINLSHSSATAKKITNNSSTTDYFIPTKTAAEWAAFLANFPGDILAALIDAILNSAVLSSTSGNVYDLDDLTVAINASNSTTEITDWRVDGVSMAVLNMPMDSNANDYSTYGNNGTVTDATWTDNECEVGGCYSFDGTGDYIEIADSASLDITSAITIEAWVKTSTAGTVIEKISSGQAGATYTFANCSSTGTAGPSQANCDTAYTSTTLDGAVTVTSGVQAWTVPSTATYTLDARGAKGGSYSTAIGGKGARMVGDFSLTGSDVLNILVGQLGQDGTGGYGSGGGGGGSFVYESGSPLIVAGGGGGGSYYSGTTSHGLDASTTTTGTGSGSGTGGAGGAAGSGTGGNGGGGITGNGGSSGYGSVGISYSNGGVGGVGYSIYDGDGGFGGGGSNGFSAGGGAGGYSGGVGGGNGGSPAAGGGGSYNDGTNQSNTADYSTGHGSVIVTLPNTGTVPFHLSTDSGGKFSITESGTEYSVTSSLSVNDGEWHHLVGKYDGTTMKIYVDGVEKGSEAVGLGTITTNDNAVRMGDGLNGLLDEAAIYNRALSAAQITDIYDAGVAGHQLETIDDGETEIGEAWTVNVTPNNGVSDGTPVLSNGLTVVTIPPNSAVLSSASGNNYDDDDLTVVLTAVEATTKITDWRIDGTSMAVLNMPMDSDADDYSTYTNDGTVTNAIFTSTGCQVGGCYTFDGTGDYIEVADANSLDPTSEITLEAWVKTSVAGPVIEKLVEAGSGDSYTFTNCSQTSRTGPAQASCDTAYTSTNLDGAVTVTSGIQMWTLPATGTYTIEAIGARGGGADGGKGARMIGDFSLTAADKVRVLVGQKGMYALNSCGGGGGSFVMKETGSSTSDIHVIAGGGGGSPASYSANRHAPVTNDGLAGAGATAGGAGGTGGAGGIETGRAGGGAGLTGNGGTYGGIAFTSGATGGDSNYDGGFGGGGAAYETGFRGSGGGGGYSGGGSGSVYSASNTTSGGGGGSYNNGTSQSNTAGYNSGDGSVIITAPGNSNIPYTLSTTSGGEFSITKDGTEYSVTSSLSVNDGAWHHLVGKYDGTTMKIYVDGVEKGSQAVGLGAIPTTTTALRIGEDFNGLIDEAKVFGRSLSAAQITDLYDAGVAGTQLETIDDAETETGEAWTVNMTPNNGTIDDTPVLSNTITISACTSGNDCSTGEFCVEGACLSSCTVAETCSPYGNATAYGSYGTCITTSVCDPDEVVYDGSSTYYADCSTNASAYDATPFGCDTDATGGYTADGVCESGGTCDTDTICYDGSVMQAAVGSCSDDDACDTDVSGGAYSRDGYVCSSSCVVDASVSIDGSCCANANCASGDCTGSVCVASCGANDTASCTTADDCCSDACVGGTCRASCASYGGVACSDDGTNAYTADGACTTSSVSCDEDEVAFNGSTGYYTDCSGLYSSGSSEYGCDSDATGGYSVTGMCILGGVCQITDVGYDGDFDTCPNLYTSGSNDVPCDSSTSGSFYAGGLCVVGGDCRLTDVCYNGSYYKTMTSCNDGDTCDVNVGSNGYDPDGLVCNDVCVGNGSVAYDGACCANANCASGDCTGGTCAGAPSAPSCSGSLESESFESSFGGWTTELESGCSPCSVTRSTAQSTVGSYSAKVYSGSYGEYAALIHSGLGMTGSDPIAFDIRFESTSNYAGYFNAFDSGGTPLITWNFSSTQMSYYNGSSYVPFKSLSFNTWYSIVIDVDFASNTYDIYINGTLEVDNATFRNSGSNIDKLQVTSGGGSSNAAIIYVDGMCVD